MEKEIIGYLLTFIAGTLLGVISTIAAFKSSVAVLKVQSENTVECVKKLERDFEKWKDEVDNKLADIARQVGNVKRFSDERGT